MPECTSDALRGTAADLRIPLFVGVVGHHDLSPEQQASLRAPVRRLLTGLQGAFPHTPLVLLSSLGQGSERAAAEVGRELKIDVVQVRPAHCPAGCTLAVLGPEGELPSLPALPEADQAAVGAFLALHCQVLIACYDDCDESADVLGSPGQVMSWCLHGIARQPPIHPLETPDKVVVLCIRQPHGSIVPTQPYSWYVTCPEGKRSWARRLWLWVLLRFRWFGSGLGNTARQLDWIDTFNGDCKQAAQKSDSTTSSDVDRSMEELLLWTELENLAEPRKTLVGNMCRWYAQADVKALVFQSRVRPLLRVAFVGAFFLGLAKFGFLSFSNEKEAMLHNVCAIGWVVLMVILGGIFFFLGVRGWRRKHQDYRALAEGLRVQVFWSLADIEDTVADHYPLLKRDDLDWVRPALRGYWVRAKVGLDGVAPTPTTDPHRTLLLNRWVVPQLDFLKDRAEKFDARHWRLQLWKWCTIGVGCLVGAWNLAPLIVHKQVKSPTQLLNAFLPALSGGDTAIRLFDKLFIPACFFLGALIFSWAKIHSFQIHAERYRRLRKLYQRADTTLRVRQPPLPLSGDERAVLVSLGQEALEENARWLREERKKAKETPQT